MLPPTSCTRRSCPSGFPNPLQRVPEFLAGCRRKCIFCGHSERRRGSFGTCQKMRRHNLSSLPLVRGLSTFSANLQDGRCVCVCACVCMRVCVCVCESVCVCVLSLCSIAWWRPKRCWKHGIGAGSRKDNLKPIGADGIKVLALHMDVRQLQLQLGAQLQNASRCL